MSKRTGSRTAGALAAIAALSTAAADPRTTADGVYTSAQAEAGRDVHRRHCAECHDPGYYQGSFLEAWRQVPVAVLYDVIELKMPENAPGALTRDEYTAVLAFVLELNGLPAGDEPLGEGRNALNRVLITSGGEP